MLELRLKRWLPVTTERIFITRRDIAAAMNRYLAKEEPGVQRLLRPLWKRQKEIFNENTFEQIIRIRSVPQRLTDKWFEIANEWMDEKMIPVYEKTIKAAGTLIEKRVNESRKQDFNFNMASASVFKWMTEHGGALIRQLSTKQAASINALLSHQAFMGITSPALLAERLLPLVGLLDREALAVVRYQSELEAAGIPAETVREMVEKYADFLHKNRAFRIARTELANAYNYGQWEAIDQAVHAGLFPGEVEKEWLTAGDENTCSECEDMDGETAKHDEPFSNGYMVPPAHVQCRCSATYSVIRS